MHRSLLAAGVSPFARSSLSRLTRSSRSLLRISRSTTLGRPQLSSSASTLTAAFHSRSAWLLAAAVPIASAVVDLPSAIPSHAAALSPLEQSYLDLLRSSAPCFPLSSSSVRLLSTPTEFFTTLHSLLQKAERRICISSLYLGTGEHEQKLVEAMAASMQARPELRTHVLLDYLRGTRPVGEKRENSITTLNPLLGFAPSSTAASPSNPADSSDPPSRFTLSLLHVPPPRPPEISSIRAAIERRFFTGDKTREAVGVHHMKFYVVDDAVIISG